MSDVKPPAAGIMSRKWLGIPVAYYALIVALVIAYYAWRARPVAAPVPEPEMAGGTEAYPAMSYGTVAPVTYEAPQNPFTPPVGNASIANNDEWLAKGVALLSERGTSPGDAQLALQAYLNGEDLTFQQGGMRDMVIREYGLPPAPGVVGRTADAPARAQGPVPRDHTVRSATEDSAAELAALYYGNGTGIFVDAIIAANDGRSTFSSGEAVHIPAKPVPAPAPVVPAPVPAPMPVAPTPSPSPVTRAYTVVRGDNLSSIARRYGTTWQAIFEANRGQIKNANLIYPGQVLIIP